MTNHDYVLQRFGEGLPPAAHAIAALHWELLPDSPATRFGHRFLERFHYGSLPDKGLISGSVAFVDQVPAGFVAVTGDSDGFMVRALLKSWPALIQTAPLVLGHLGRASKAGIESLRILVSRSRDKASAPIGEILSFGVLPAYRSQEFVNRSGHQIAHDLFDNAISDLEAAGVGRARAVIDADNLLAQVFYQSRGWRLTRQSVPGWATPSVEYTVDLDRRRR